MSQYNIVFSQEFGPKSTEKKLEMRYKSEEEFLRNQYFCI